MADRFQADGRSVTNSLVQTKSVPQTVAILGGGFSGAAVAYHLALGGREHADIFVFEPRESIGKGLAYDTADPSHRINVPATRMSLLPDDPDHFARWVEQQAVVADDPDAARPNGDVYPRRGVFGAYVHDQLSSLLQSGAVRHARAEVRSVTKIGDRWQVTASNGETVIADVVVIATTHPAPSAPLRLAHALAQHPRFIADPLEPRCLDVIRPQDRVLIVGNGLTSADVIASLTRRGHRGGLVSVSRRGLRSRGHAPLTQEPFGDFLNPPAKTALELLVRIRAAIRDAGKSGLTWHAVIDQVRMCGQEIWSHLPVHERRQVVRHLRPYWDVHRFRIAPQVEDVIDTALAEGRLQVERAGIGAVRTFSETIFVTLAGRGAPVQELAFDAVVVTTGPAHGQIFGQSDWLRQLAADGHVHLDPTGLGLACNARSQALDTKGEPDKSLLIAGPLARGYFGELMGLPQVSEHAVLVAQTVMDAISD